MSESFVNVDRGTGARVAVDACVANRSADGLLKWLTMLDENDGRTAVTTLEYGDGPSVGGFNRWHLQLEIQFPIYSGKRIDYEP